MSGVLVYLLAAATAMCGYHVLGDVVTWPGCMREGSPIQPYNTDRVVEPGEVDHKVNQLFLERCNLSSLKPQLLNAYPNLQTLYVNDNNIKVLESGTFAKLSSLNYLSLRKNAFLGKDLPSDLFRDCARFYGISLSDNNMVQTPSDLLLGCKNLIELYCRNCSLHQIPSFITRSVFPRTLYLYLNDNQLTKLDDETTFVNLGKLVTLELVDNKIDHLHENLLRPLAQISTIKLNGNKIRFIPEQLFQNKSSLESLNLANNLIYYISDRAFIGTRLKTLNLSDNKLTYLSDSFFKKLESSGVTLSSFYFDGNPWPCACLNELLGKVKALNIDYEHSKYNGNTKNCIMAMTDSFECRPDIYQDFFMKFIRGDK